MGHFEHGNENSCSIKRGEFLKLAEAVQDFSHHTCQSRVVSSPDFMWCFLIIVLFYATVYYVLANLCLRMLFILSMSL